MYSCFDVTLLRWFVNFSRFAVTLLRVSGILILIAVWIVHFTFYRNIVTLIHNPIVHGICFVLISMLENRS